MGWSWAFYYCHEVLLQAALRSGLSRAQQITATAPIPDLKAGAFLPYADNGVVVCSDRERAQKLKDAWMNVLREDGLVVHEETAASSAAECLGVNFNGRDLRVGPTAKRLWRLRLCVRLF